MFIGQGSFAYQTLKTSHFYIHYPREVERKTALEIGGWAEGAYETLRKVFPFDVAPVHIQVHNLIDESNGSAGAVQFNKINLYLQKPGFDSELQSPNWFQTLLIHELTHIFELDASRGYAAGLRFIFGKPPIPYSTPNYTAPIWFHEGMAVFNETLYTPSGRLNSTEYNAVYRRHALYGNFPPLSRLSSYYSNPDYPSGSSPYIYGAGIFDEIFRLGGKKGNDTGMLSYVQSGRFYYWFNYGFETFLDWKNQAYLETMKKNPNAQSEKLFPDVIDNYKDMYGFFASQETSRQGFDFSTLAEKPLTQPETVLDLDDKNIKMLIYSPVDKKLYFVRSSNAGKNALASYDPKTKEFDVLFKEFGFGERLTVSQTGKIYMYFYKMNNNKTFAVPYVFDPYKKDLKKISSKLIRFMDIAPSPDEKKIVGISLDPLGYKHLEIFDVRTESKTRLIENFDGLYPYFINEKEIIYFEYPTPDSRLSKINIQTKEIQEIASLPGRIKHPYAQSGQIYFAGNQNGVFNLYSYDLNTRKLKILTNLQTDGKYPFASEEKIYFLTLGPRNYRIAAVSFKDVPEYDFLPAVSNQRIEPEPYQKKEIEADIENYSPFSYLRPQWWLPFIQQTETESYYGFATSWADPLERHFISLLANYNFEKKGMDYFQYGASYDYIHESGFLASLSTFRYMTIYKNVPLNPRGYGEYCQNEMQNLLYLGYSLNTLSYSLTFLGGGIYKTWKGVDTPSNLFYSFYQDDFYGPRGKIVFTNQSLFFDSFMPEDGFYFSAVYTHYLKPKMQEITANLNIAVGGILFENAVISTTHSAGGLYGKKFPQDYFTLGGISYDYASASLRGYPADSLHGYFFLSNSLEYTVPVFYFNGGWKNAAFFLRSLYLNFFYDYAQTNNTGFENLKLDQFYVSYGAEIGGAAYLGYMLPVNLILGVAYAQNTKETTFYFSVKMPISTSDLGLQKNISRKFYRKPDLKN